jgi:small subunit ribosomal protein S8
LKFPEFVFQSSVVNRKFEGVGELIMTMTDPVSDLLTRIRNASKAKHETVDIPSSRLKLEIARILKEEGYISNFSVVQNDKQGIIRVQLRYAGKDPVISSLERISRPGCRVYAGRSDIPSVLGGLGICILSTSQGVLTGKQAQEKGLGGEVLCTIC